VSRAWAIGVAGIAALLASSIGVISLTTRDGGDPGALEAHSGAAPYPSSPRDSATAAPASSAVPTLPEAAGDSTRSAASTPPAPAPRAPPESPSRTGNNALTPATHHARISFRGQLIAGVAEIQKLVAHCAAETTFILDVETGEAGIRILDVQPEPGVSTDQEAACARSALKGKVFPPPSAEPGRRWKMPLNVRPTG
jgi:hypothetical protein